MHGTEHRFVILIHQDDDAAAGLFVCFPYYGHEAAGVGNTFAPGFVKFLPSFELSFEDTFQRLATVVFFGIEVKVEHWIFLPVLFQLFDSQSFE